MSLLSCFIFRVEERSYPTRSGFTLVTYLLRTSRVSFIVLKLKGLR